MLMWYYFYAGLHTTFKRACAQGFVWGVCFYALHLVWFLCLFVTKSQVSVPASCLWYAIMVLYFSCIAGVWFGAGSWLIMWCKQTFLRAISSLFVVLGYFVFNDYWGLLVFGSFDSCGYPFANPLIPLVRYSWFLAMVSFFGNCLYGPTQQRSCFEPDQVELVHIKPKKSRSVQQRVYGVYQAIGAHKLSGTVKHVLFVAPESTIPFHINQEPWMIQMLQCALPANGHLLIGAQFENEQHELHQAIYCLDLRRIKTIYKKTHSVPFVEKMPPFFKKCAILRDIFLKDLRETIEGSSKEKTAPVFEIDSENLIVPRMCSELFFMSRAADFLAYRMMKKKVVLFFFVNDSWFVDYFTKIMENVTCIKAAWFGLPIVYIGHECYQKIKL
ncbi:hypothetical protein K2W90_03835 [Candidatus Babeliales bacterium]|nr:hypothetical protein [Candidatus Babeliales bacterium]